MDVQEYLSSIPFQELLGIELVSASAGSAEMALELGPDLSSSERRIVAHGGVVATLADSVGGAAAISLNEAVTPTVDIRIDYLAPARTDLRATGEVVRNGETLSTVDIDVHDAAGTHVATAQGVYKVSGADPMAWVEPVDRPGGEP
jgi:uncharacterized protein (TIGR00369 family)